MTELELAKRIGRLLPDAYEFDFLPSGEVTLMRITSYTAHGAKYVIRVCLDTWRSVSRFLFGVHGQLSFFGLIDRWKCMYMYNDNSEYSSAHISEEFDAINEIYAFCPEIVTLAGCSSASELELKFAIMGI